MVRILAIISFLLLFKFSLPVVDKQLENTDIKKTIDSVQSEISGKDNPAVLDTLNSFYQKIQHISGSAWFSGG